MAGRVVVHPEGKFDIDALVDEMSKVEEQGYRVTKIIVSRSQMVEIRLMDKQLDTWNWNTNRDESLKMFGIDLQAADWKPWCVNIVQEF